MPKVNPLTYEDVASVLEYDQETGGFTWLVNIARNIKAGNSAGCAKGARWSKRAKRYMRYVYIRLRDIDTPAARLAWLLHYKKWPDGNVLFDDGDTENLRIANLKESKNMRTTTGTDGVKSRRMTREAQRAYGLRRYYGLTGDQYGEMLAAQHGLCAVCGRPETAMYNGRPKVMHVDHDHANGRIRELLCGSCNGMLGLAKDSRDTLLAAVRYLDKHTDAANVVTLAVREHTE